MQAPIRLTNKSVSIILDRRRRGQSSQLAVIRANAMRCRRFLRAYRSPPGWLPPRISKQSPAHPRRQRGRPGAVHAVFQLHVCKRPHVDRSSVRVCASCTRVPVVLVSLAHPASLSLSRPSGPFTSERKLRTDRRTKQLEMRLDDPAVIYSALGSSFCSARCTVDGCDPFRTFEDENCQ